MSECATFVYMLCVYPVFGEMHIVHRVLNVGKYF